jgi:putative tryptophan/tyrosine transport system substrate-binding protein
MRRRDLIALIAGAAIVWPVYAGAQQPMPVIGFLSAGSPESDDFRLTAFRQGLNETGYAEGENVVIEYRWAQGQNDRLPVLAAELVRQQVTVIATVGPPPVFAAKAVTSTIPIVFVVGTDTVQSGLVASLNWAGRNITGVALISAELAAKRLQLLHELVPSAAPVALLVDPTNPTSDPITRSLQDAAGSLGLQLHVLRASTASEIDAAFGALPELRAGALVLAGGPFFTNQRAQIVALAARHAVPTIYGVRLFPAAGGLMSYGTDLADSFRQAGVYAGKSSKVPSPPTCRWSRP